MSSCASSTQQLLNRAARRQRLANYARHLRLWTLIFAGAFLALILFTRLTALVPDVFSWPSLLVVPLLALVAAWFTHPRESLAQAAARVDGYAQNHDLFLTTVHLGESAGKYQERVRHRADAAAEHGVDLSRAIPWNWPGNLKALLAGVVVIVAVMLWLPQLDPFGKDEVRQWLGKKGERLEELRKEMEILEQARHEAADAEESESIEQALTKLENTFRLAKPEEKRDNARELSGSQKKLGHFWKQLNDKKLGEALDKASERLQEFGMTNPTSAEARELREKLREMLASGDAKAIQEKISELLQKAEDINGAGGGEEKNRETLRDVQQGMQALADAISQEMKSPQLSETLQRALEQLQLAQNAQLTDQALRDAQRSMEQLQQQMGDLAQQLDQLQQLEEALDATQLAKQLNELGKLGQGEGELGQGSGSSISDYKALYERILAEAQGSGEQGRGMGMGNRGQGEGGEAPEDETLETDFKKEKSSSSLVAGRMLMEWKTKGVSEAGEAVEAYEETVAALRQGVSEAIRQEKIPAGYHESIRGYFDTLAEEKPSTDDLD